MTADVVRPGRSPGSLEEGGFSVREGEAVVRVSAWPEPPVPVRQTSEQTVSFGGEVPVCIRVCEPVCARSDYGIGITLFDRPVATIRVSGTTRIDNCGPAAPR